MITFSCLRCSLITFGACDHWDRYFREGKNSKNGGKEEMSMLKRSLPYNRT
jgi:hypothetical protein